MMRALVLVGIMLRASAALATHILGGELWYVHQGGDSYLFTLKLYRDCGPGNANGTGFDAQAELGVFDASGTYLFSEMAAFPGATTVPVVLNNPCLTAPPTICVEEAAYSIVIDLPPMPGGYVVSYQRCCRTPTILNLATPGDEGLTCTVAVPDVGQTGANSSPAFNAYPPIALCVGQHMSFDHSATDPDGDVLVYELCTPFTGGAPGNPAPSPPTGPPYTPVLWGPGYSQAYQMDANPALAIDPVSGLLTVTPSQAGSYVVGVCVKEYRAGVLLSEVRRDLRFDAVPCMVTILSSIQQQQTFCDGYQVAMVNQSLGGSSYLWDFGDPNSSTDTSALFAPSYTYSDTGTFNVMLVVNPGWPCADTSYASFQVHPPLDPVFVPPPIQCLGAGAVPLLATGNFTPQATVAWDLGPGAAPQQMAGPSIGATFVQPGQQVVTVTVSDHGCADSYTDTVQVFPPPVPLFTTDTMGCLPLEVRFDNQSTAWTPMRYAWDLGDGTASADLFPVHTYTTEGQFDVRLTVMTDSGCIDTVSLLRPAAVRVWEQPVAGLYTSTPVVDVLDPVVTVHDASTGADSWLYTVAGSTYTTPEFTIAFADAGAYEVVQVVTSGLGCRDTASIRVTVTGSLFHAPTAFTPDGDGLNDQWLPVVIGARAYDLAIYDRWGTQVFHTLDPHAGWDGAAMPVGVYTYKAWLAEHGPERRAFVGSITLVR
ncbi:MAG: hypothetical protein GFGODING_03089 [Flavobacteriales bacterium]|nr:hypothetical protein [Flavobacteriales bacterium]